MAKEFALDDAADFDLNIDAFGAALNGLDVQLGPALAQKLKGTLERGDTLDALMAAIATSTAKS